MYPSRHRETLHDLSPLCLLNKVQINYYAAGLHQKGSDAVFRYTNLELKDRYELILAAFGIP